MKTIDSINVINIVFFPFLVLATISLFGITMWAVIDPAPKKQITAEKQPLRILGSKELPADTMAKGEKKESWEDESIAADFFTDPPEQNDVSDGIVDIDLQDDSSPFGNLREALDNFDEFEGNILISAQLSFSDEGEEAFLENHSDVVVTLGANQNNFAIDSQDNLLPFEQLKETLDNYPEFEVNVIISAELAFSDEGEEVFMDNREQTFQGGIFENEMVEGGNEINTEEAPN